MLPRLLCLLPPLQADLPASFITATGATDCESAASALQAAAQVMSALGGQALGRWALCVCRSPWGGVQADREN